MSRSMLYTALVVCSAAVIPHAVRAGGSCEAGCDKQFHCVKCSSAPEPDWSCDVCCAGCESVKFDGGSYCTCKGPTPPSPPGPTSYKCGNGQCYAGTGGGFPFPSKESCEAKCTPGPLPSGPDTWATYEVDGMQCLSVVGGKDPLAYEKVVILLHGGGGEGTDWEYQYSAGWFGNLTGLKFVFPTSPDHLWYRSYKNGCGLLDDCAYNISDLHYKAGLVEAVINQEVSAAPIGGVKSNVILAGFSEGAQMTGYMQLAHLDYALGGTVVMDGFPLPPLMDMAAPGATPAAAKANATYYGHDMRWMIWWGSDDPIFPADLSIKTWNGIFDVLGVNDTLKIEHVEQGMSHTVIAPEFAQMMRFVRGGV